MKHSVCVVTGSRAEFGLLWPLLKRLNEEPCIELRLVVTGSHLSDQFGNTKKEIEASALPIHAQIPIPIEIDSKVGMTKTTGAAMVAFAEYFDQNIPDLLVVLGDRYEIFAVSSAAALMGIPIAHIHGGELTEGAVDDALRHSISKMSWLHFTACEEYRRRVIQLGESPERVFNVGALGVENLLHISPMTVEELGKSLEFDLVGKPFSVVTFHPVTKEENTSGQQLRELISAMDEHSEMNYIVTLANADAGGREINKIWAEEAERHENWVVIPSLGARRYISALKYAEMMIGNSSSGIIEAPAAHIPTVNIGDRQRGRLMAESVICCLPEKDAISAAITQALTPEHQAITRKMSSPFGDGNTSEQIVKEMIAFLDTKESDHKKAFFNIEVTI